MNEKVTKLRDLWNSNGGLSLETRKNKLKALEKCIQKNEALITRALRDDLGKSAFETYSSEIGFILGDISYALKNLHKWTKVKRVSGPLAIFPARSFIVPDPLGVVLIISPWNYPFMLALSPLIGAVAAGNRIVLKPSELSPHTTSALKTVVSEVFSADEVVVVEGGVEETQELLKLKFDHIFFTGSTAVGKVIMKAAAEHLTPVTLELGGKSPLLVEDSANLDIAAKRCVWGKFMNAGQTCVAPDYVLVSKDNQKEFLQRLKFHIESFYGRNARASEDYGRLISQRHHRRLASLISKDKIFFGGEGEESQRYLGPTVLENISWDDRIMDEEIFGPILPVLTYSSLAEAIDLIKSKPSPLAFYLFTEKSDVATEILGKVSFGGGCVNDTIIHLANHNLPFGGIGESGMGSYHGKRSFETFTHFKPVVRNTTRIDIPVRYPPYRGKLGWLKLFLG